MEFLQLLGAILLLLGGISLGIGIVVLIARVFEPFFSYIKDIVEEKLDTITDALDDYFTKKSWKREQKKISKMK